MGRLRRLERPLLLAMSALVLAACAGDAPKTPPPGVVVPSVTATPPRSSLRAGDLINGCTEANTLDFSSQRRLTITFGEDKGDAYAPRCLQVSDDAEVRFAGPFGSHPLVGGVIIDNQPHPDGRSPIPLVNAGELAPFRPAEPGIYPFYCQVHWSAGMMGVVIAN